MKRSIVVMAVLGVVLLSLTGCVQTQVTRQVRIHKDVNGKVTGYTEIESATQVGSAFKFTGFEHLKAGPGEREPMKIY